MQRRTFLLTSLLPALLASAAESSEIDPKQTFVLQRDGIRFAPWAGLPPASIQHLHLSIGRDIEAGPGDGIDGQH